MIINLNKGKTKSMLLGSSKIILNKSLKICINDSLINFTAKYKYLGAVIDQTSSLGEHLSLPFKKASGRMRLLKKIQPMLTLDAAESIYKCMIVPLTTNSSIATLNLSPSQISKVQNLQHKATRIIRHSISDAYLRLPDIVNFAHFQTCLLVRQCIDKNTVLKSLK